VKRQQHHARVGGRQPSIMAARAFRSDNDHLAFFKHFQPLADGGGIRLGAVQGNGLGCIQNPTQRGF
jgi:hypothetical protein